MIQPNFNLLLWIMLVMITIDSVCKILLGLSGDKRLTEYGAGDVLEGMFWLVVCIIVLLA